MTEHEEQQSQDGQVSEVANLGDGSPIAPDQSVGGAPDAESGEVQEGRQGPNARTGDRDPRHRDSVQAEADEDDAPA